MRTPSPITEIGSRRRGGRIGRGHVPAALIARTIAAVHLGTSGGPPVQRRHRAVDTTEHQFAVENGHRHRGLLEQGVAELMLEMLE